MGLKKSKHKNRDDTQVISKDFDKDNGDIDSTPFPGEIDIVHGVSPSVLNPNVTTVHKVNDEKIEKDIADLNVKLEKYKTNRVEEVASLRQELEQHKKLTSEGIGKIRHDIAKQLADLEIKIVNHQTQPLNTPKFEDVQILIQTALAEFEQKIVPTNTDQLKEEITQKLVEYEKRDNENLNKLMNQLKILSISTVNKNTAHLNFPPTQAMETVEITIYLTRGTEGKAPRSISVKNLMKMTTILELKCHLSDKYKHLKKQELVVKWDSVELSDAVTLLEYGIDNGDRLELEVRALVTYPIKVMMSSRNNQDPISIDVDVTPATKIISLKDLIYDKIAIQIDQQVLKHNDNILEDYKTLAEYQIKEKDTIILEMYFKGNFQISITFPSGKKIELQAENSDTIELIKNQIQSKEHIHILQQELYYKGVELENHKKLGDYRITRGEILNVQIKNRPTSTSFPQQNLFVTN